jgi:protein-disulfide isomerase
MARRTHVRDQRQPNKRLNRRWISIGLITLGALVIVGLLIYLNLNNQPAAVTVQFTPAPNANGLSMGKADAPVKVEEYSDFQCPYCKQYFTDIEPGVIQKYVATGKVFFTYNPFSFIGPESKLAAEAAFCAADQNKFWEMHYQIFNAQGTENSGIFTKTSLNRLASQVGLDLPKLRDCLDTGKYTQKVEDENQAAMNRKVESTPSFFVNGKGPIMMTDVVAEIDKALAGQ